MVARITAEFNSIIASSEDLQPMRDKCNVSRHSYNFVVGS